MRSKLITISLNNIYDFYTLHSVPYISKFTAQAIGLEPTRPVKVTG